MQTLQHTVSFNLSDLLLYLKISVHSDGLTTLTYIFSKIIDHLNKVLTLHTKWKNMLLCLKLIKLKLIKLHKVVNIKFRTSLSDHSEGVPCIHRDEQTNQEQ
jgi:hypothetical protein